MQIRQRVYEVLEVAAESDATSRRVHAGIMALIVVNLAGVVFGTVSAFYSAAPWLFDGLEAVSIVIFTIEYLLRLWACGANPQYAGLLGRARFAFRPMMLVDLVAILPAYLPMVVVDLRALRALRVMRLARVLRLARYSRAVDLLGRAFGRCREELITTCCLMGVLIAISASAMYYAENEAQPDRFSSIPAAMWWAVATLTTVGYGDIVPVTTAGKALAAVIAVVGIGMVALPTGVLGAAFVEEIRSRRQKHVCPHCGKPIE
jgi:voltage-gated potassium channel